MRRTGENSIELTQEELDSIQQFIDSSLDRQWDNHTNTFICTDSWEDGKRRMNPEMYDMAQQMLSL